MGASAFFSGFLGAPGLDDGGLSLDLGEGHEGVEGRGALGHSKDTGDGRDVLQAMHLIASYVQDGHTRQSGDGGAIALEKYRGSFAAA